MSGFDKYGLVSLVDEAENPPTDDEWRQLDEEIRKLMKDAVMWKMASRDQGGRP